MYKQHPWLTHSPLQKRKKEKKKKKEVVWYFSFSSFSYPSFPSMTAKIYTWKLSPPTPVALSFQVQIWFLSKREIMKSSSPYTHHKNKFKDLKDTVGFCSSMPVSRINVRSLYLHSWRSQRTLVTYYLMFIFISEIYPTITSNIFLRVLLLLYQNCKLCKKIPN